MKRLNYVLLLISLMAFNSAVNARNGIIIPSDFYKDYKNRSGYPVYEIYASFGYFDAASSSLKSVNLAWGVFTTDVTDGLKRIRMGIVWNFAYESFTKDTGARNDGLVTGNVGSIDPEFRIYTNFGSFPLNMFGGIGAPIPLYSKFESSLSKTYTPRETTLAFMRFGIAYSLTDSIPLTITYKIFGASAAALRPNGIFEFGISFKY